MRNLFFILCFAIFVPLANHAQVSQGFGLKVGLNYNTNGDYFNTVEMNTTKPERNTGYHVGLFGKIGQDIYFRPELIFTNTKSDYNSDTFEMQKLDAPLLIGCNIFGPVSILAGPTLQYILDSEFEGIAIEDIENNFSVGLNFGIGINFKKIGIDLRYERGFSDNEATFIGKNTISAGRLDSINTRPEQFILSLSLLL